MPTKSSTTYWTGQQSKVSPGSLPTTQEGLSLGKFDLPPIEKLIVQSEQSSSEVLPVDSPTQYLREFQTTKRQNDLALRSSVVERLLPPPAKPGMFDMLPPLRTRQLWEGTVINVFGGKFEAKLRDRTNPTNPEEFGVFEVDEVSAEDEPLVKPGSAFYWVIGNETTRAGQVKGVSFVQFRRTASWTQTALNRTKQLAAQFQELDQE